MRLALALFMLLHGVAHIVGFLGAWHPERLAGFSYHTTIFGGLFSVGDAGIRLLGLFWLGLAIAFVAVAGFTMANRPGWIPYALGITTVSFAFCLIGWPDAKIGVGVNAAIALAIVLGQRSGWL
jgi:hypothetical protein